MKTYATLADMIADHASDPTTQISMAVVTPASGGFGQFDMGEIETFGHDDVREWGKDLELDPSEYVAATGADGSTYNQNGMSIFRAPDGSLHAFEMDSIAPESIDCSAWLDAEYQNGYTNEEILELINDSDESYHAFSVFPEGDYRITISWPGPGRTISRSESCYHADPADVAKALDGWLNDVIADNDISDELSSALYPLEA